MFAIIRRYTPVIEEYSIDEAFAEITGLQPPLNMSYRTIAQAIQTTIAQELGITVSIGLSLSKTLAKLGSNARKPSGLVTILNSRSDNIRAILTNFSKKMNEGGVFHEKDGRYTDTP